MAGIYNIIQLLAQVAKLADALGLGPSEATHAGSTPALGTSDSHRSGGFCIGTWDLKGTA